MNEMLLDNTKMYRYKWYHKRDILFKLLKFLKYRDFALMDIDEKWKISRYNFVLNETWFYKTLELRQFFTTGNYCLYMTSATFSEFPQIKNPLKKQEHKEEYMNFLINHIEKYDLLIDFDVPNKEEYVKVVNQFCIFANILYVNNIKFIAINSGGGFHITIPYDVLQFPLDFKPETRTLIHYYNFAIQLKEKFNLNYMCTVGCGVWNRLQKVPYSLISTNVCLPIYDFNPHIILMKLFKCNYYFKTDFYKLPDYLNNYGTKGDLINFCKLYNLEVY